MQLRCFITSASLGVFHLVGRTETLSRRDVLIRCEAVDQVRCPAVGDDVEIDVELPVRTLARPRVLHCIATITFAPVSENGDRFFSAAIHDMQFRDLPKRFRTASAANVAIPYMVV